MAFQNINSGGTNNNTGATNRAGSSVDLASVNPAVTSKRDNYIPFQNGTIGAVDDIQRVVDQNGNRIATKPNSFSVSINIEPIQNRFDGTDPVYDLFNGKFYSAYLQDYSAGPFTASSTTYNTVVTSIDTAVTAPVNIQLNGKRMVQG